MATKDTKLSITISAIDKATGPIRAVSAQLGQLTSPLRGFGAKLSGVTSGLFDALKRVGSMFGDMLSSIPVVGAAIAGVVGGAVYGLKSLVDEFDELGDKAEALGVGVDFLSQLRYAAKRSGASVEELDNGLQAFTTSMGLARAGTGRMAAFLKSDVQGPLLKQLRATKNNEEAFTLLAAAAKKIVDPAKRAAFAAKTLGNASLAPLLARGADGIQTLRKRYLELAGSQGEAAAKAGEADDAMVDLNASTDGLKAAIVSGLAPAMTKVIQRLTKWISEHREDVAQWAADIGEKLPGVFKKVAGFIEQAIGKAKAFFDELKKIYDKVDAFINLGEVKKANETRERRTKFYENSITDDTLTPEERRQGAVLAVVRENQLRERIKAQAEGMDWTKSFDTERFGDVSARKSTYSIEELQALIRTVGPGSGSMGADNLALITQAIGAASARGGASVATGGASGAIANLFTQVRAATATARGASPEAKAKITVDFSNAPRGTRVKTDPQSTADVDLNVGYLNPAL